MADDELRNLLEAMRQENAAAHTATRHHVDRTGEVTRRHVDVTSEATHHEIRIVAEAVQAIGAKLDRTAAVLDEKIERTAAETQAMIKFSHDELHRRVRALEEGQTSFNESIAELRARIERLEDSGH